MMNGTADPRRVTIHNGRPHAKDFVLERHGFRFRLQEMMKRRLDKLPAAAAGADLITDDFAPADIYDVMGDRPKRRK